MSTRWTLTLRQRWLAWWEARMPRQDHIRLTQRNLYILPTRAGWSFAVVVLVLLLASINEQINLGYALAFLLGGAGMAALYQTHGNLQGVSLQLQGLHSVHAGQVLRLPVSLHNGHRRLGRFGLQIGVDALAAPQQVDVAPGSEASVEVDVPTTQRGWLSLPRLTIDTRYPLGLFRAWAFWRPQSRVLVWPALEVHAPPLPALHGAAPNEVSTSLPSPSSELPEGLREHRRGDPLRWVAWKKSTRTLATSGQLVSREPASGRSPDRWLDFDQTVGLQHLPAEARLSRLACWLIEAEMDASARGALYGLRLPGQAIACGSGPHHLRQCLDALATWSPDGATTTEPSR